MDIKGHIHMLSDEDAKSFAQHLTRVPRQHEQAALDAYNDKLSLFESQNRRAAAWARMAANEMLRDAKKKRRARKANRLARIARRKHISR